MFVIYAKSLKLRHLSADSAEIIADRLRPTKHFAQLFVGPFILVPTLDTVRVALWRKLGTLKADWWSQSFPSEGHGTVERSSVEMDSQKWADLVSFWVADASGDGQILSAATLYICPNSIKSF